MTMSAKIATGPQGVVGHQGIQGEHGIQGLVEEP